MDMTVLDEVKLMVAQEREKLEFFLDPSKKFTLTDERKYTLNTFDILTHVLGSKIENLDKWDISDVELHEFVQVIAWSSFLYASAWMMSLRYLFDLECQLVRPKRNKKFLKYLRNKNRNVKTLGDWWKTEK